jgi:hypothetical protein
MRKYSHFKNNYKKNSNIGNNWRIKLKISIQIHSKGMKILYLNDLRVVNRDLLLEDLVYF